MSKLDFENINNQTFDDFMSHIGSLVDLIEEKTGCKVLIGVGIKDNELTKTGVLLSDHIDYGEVCKLLNNISANVNAVYTDSLDPSIEK